MTCNAKICSMQRLCSWSCPVSSDSLISLCSVFFQLRSELDLYIFLSSTPLSSSSSSSSSYPVYSYCLTQAALFLICPSRLCLFSFSTCLVYIPCIPLPPYASSTIASLLYLTHALRLFLLSDPPTFIYYIYILYYLYHYHS